MASTPMVPPNAAAGNPNFEGNAPAAPPPPGTDMTGICFRDQLWLNTYPLDRNLVFDYFALSPFYDWSCNNEQLRMRSIHPLDLSHLSKMTGTEYMLSEVMEPHLFVFRKQKRDSPEKVTPMLTYYILDGSIYQAPQLCNVFAARIGRALYHISKAFTTAASKLEKIGFELRGPSSHCLVVHCCWNLLRGPSYSLQSCKKVCRLLRLQFCLRYYQTNFIQVI
ncbi:hypothetical protein CsSME_00052169 [Camellia sinensis var. sinensis]